MRVNPIEVSYSNIRGGWPGTGNLNAVPLFVSPRPSEEAPTAGGEYHIRGGSPCIDAGDATGAPLTAIGGEPRPLDAGYDIGADEVQACHGAPDTAPSPFTLVDRFGVGRDVSETSNTITLSGMCSLAPISIVGGEYSVNGEGFTGTVGEVNTGDAIAVRVQSSTDYLTTTTATLTIGGVSDSFSVTTQAESCSDSTPFPFAFVERTSVGRDATVTSNTIIVGGICMPAPISIAGGVYSIDGGAYLSAPGVVHNGDSVKVRVQSASSYSTTTSATLAIGDVGEVFSVTTLAEPCADATPDSFSFEDQTDVATNTAVTSKAITVSGICLPTPITVVGGSYSVNGGMYKTTAGTVYGGNTVAVQVQSAGISSTTTNATLTIGGVSDIFSVTTLPAREETVRFGSAAAQDGWVLESTERSGRGGVINARATTIRLGDDARDRQFRGVLSFDTKALPDNAVISAATLSFKRQGIVGSEPFGTHGDLVGDIVRGAFSGSAALQLSDFKAAPSEPAGITAFAEAQEDWFSASLGDSARSFINKRGRTQVRLRFTGDDNDDRSADYLLIYSGNAAADLRPLLEVVYSVP